MICFKLQIMTYQHIAAMHLVHLFWTYMGVYRDVQHVACKLTLP